MVSEVSQEVETEVEEEFTNEAGEIETKLVKKMVTETSLDYGMDEYIATVNTEGVVTMETESTSPCVFKFKIDKKEFKWAKMHSNKIILEISLLSKYKQDCPETQRQLQADTIPADGTSTSDQTQPDPATTDPVPTTTDTSDPALTGTEEDSESKGTGTG